MPKYKATNKQSSANDHPHREDAGSPILPISVDNAINPPACWPKTLQYLTIPQVSPYLNEPQIKWLQRKPRQNTRSENDNSQRGAVDASSLPTIRLPLARSEIDGTVEVRRIQNEDHPAHGQLSLLAARNLSPDDMIIPYIGYVHSSTTSEQAQAEAEGQHDDYVDPQKPGSQIKIGSWDTSSYDLNLYRDETIELAIDAEQMGNEARFCNDYRGVPAPSLMLSSNKAWDRKSKRSAKSWASKETSVNNQDVFKYHDSNTAIPNAEFRDVWLEWPCESAVVHPESTDLPLETRTDTNELSAIPSTVPGATPTRRRRKNGMRGVALFVLPAGKSGKRKDGIRAGQEILVSYGKGFWAHHVV